MSDLPKTRAALIRFYQDKPNRIALWENTKDISACTRVCATALYDLLAVYSAEKPDVNMLDDENQPSICQIRKEVGMSEEEALQILRKAFEDYEMRNEK